MHKSLLALLAATALSSGAFAADLPRSYTKSPAMVVAHNWTGGYIGLNAGYGWGRLSDTAGSVDLNGFVGGGQIGYNWQAPGSAWVFGIEADFQGSGQSRTETFTLLGIPVSVEGRLPWFATIRGRLGVAAWDRGLIYATGGVSFSNVKMTVSALGASASSSDTKAGWALGGGYEHAFSRNWSGKIEYLYLDTGNTSVTLFGATVDGRGRNHILRAGLNYHF